MPTGSLLFSLFGKMIQWSFVPEVRNDRPKKVKNSKECMTVRSRQNYH
jgi:hypothetical protein